MVLLFSNVDGEANLYTIKFTQFHLKILSFRAMYSYVVEHRQSTNFCGNLPARKVLRDQQPRPDIRMRRVKSQCHVP